MDFAVRSRECAFRRCVDRGPSRVLPRDSAQAFDFFGLWSWGETPPPVSRTAISYAVTINVAGDGSLKNAVQDASSLYKLRQGRAARRRCAGAARAKRFRPDHRRHVGRWLLRRDRHDLDRRRQPEHPLQRHRRLCARRGELPQPRRRAGVDQRQSGTAIQSPLDPRARVRTARSFRKPNFRARIVRLKPGDPAAAARSARRASADRRLFPKTRAAVRQGRVDRPRGRSRSPRDGPDVDGRIRARSPRSAKRR